MNFDEIKKINFDECLCNENSIVILVNCLENSSKIADNSIDLIFADPPYNIGKDFGNNKDKWNSTDEYIFLYANNDSIMQRNKTRGKELSKAWIDRSRTWFCTIETGLKIVVEPDIREWIVVAHKMAFADV